MNNRQSRTVDTVRNVQAFLDSHAAIIGATIAASRRNLDDAETELTGYADAQIVGNTVSRGETNRQRSLRATLRYAHMRPIAEVARQKLRDVPEFSALTMPSANATSTQLVAHAKAMGAAAAPYEAVFKSVGLPDDFLAALDSAADTLTASVTQRSDQSRRRLGATAGLAAEEKRAVSTIRLIDAIVRPKLGSDDALLREWKAAKRVPRKTGGDTTTSTPTPTPTPGTGTTSTQPATQPAAAT